MLFKIGDKKYLLATIDPSPEEIKCAEENYNTMFPGEGEWKFRGVIPESLWERPGEKSPFQGPTWLFEMQRKTGE